MQDTTIYQAVAVACLLLLIGSSTIASASVADCYAPIKGGLRLRITTDRSADRPKPGSRIGVVSANSAYDGVPAHQQILLFPPADKSMVWNKEELPKLDNYSFRPVILAYAAPRFLFDYHSAGGLLGHLVLGLSTDAASKWFHDWSEIDLTYTNGRIQYVLRDPMFPGTVVTLSASPQAGSAGLIVQIRVEGLKSKASLVCAYGGASAFFTNWAMNAGEFRYSPGQCSKDTIRLGADGMALIRGFDSSDVCMNEPFQAAQHLNGWKAVIESGSSWKGRLGFGDPNEFMKTPADLAKATSWKSGAATEEKTNCVGVELIELPDKHAEGYFVIGMGGNIRDAIRRPATAWKAAVDRNNETANRVVTHTPDPYLDAAMPMMAFATEGTWGGNVILHGAWSWRYGYLGWRGWYGSTCYGWTDRIKESIQNHIRLSLVTQGEDKGAIGQMTESAPGVYYNMNEVFLDQVRQYFEYTNDVELMKQIFPVLEGIIEWENRRLQPDNEYLYEDALDTWVSDQHWYIRGQCTQASAYMLRANTFLADIARRIGNDPAPFTQRADRIRAAMQKKLWMPKLGVFADYKDTRGNKLLHPEPELATIYHSSEFGAADPMQIYQMLYWADTHLRSESIPGNGKLWWSSNWCPNAGRSYTHSTMDLVYGENLNLALVDCQLGRADEAYSIVRGAMAGIFNGPAVGGLACHAYIDGRSRANDFFTDAISMWGRTIMEGLFGISPKRPDSYIDLCPQFPNHWPGASIKTPHFSYSWKRSAGGESIDWNSPVATSVHLRLPVRASHIDQVRVDGLPAEYEVEAGVGLVWVKLATPVARRGLLEISYKEDETRLPDEVVVRQGQPVRVGVPGGGAVYDPQGLMTGGKVEYGNLTGVADGRLGPGLLFVSAGDAPCLRWVPVRLRIESKVPVAPKIWAAPKVAGHDLSYWATIDLGGVFNTSVTEAMPQVLAAVKPPALPASSVNTDYYKDHISDSFATPKPSDAAWRNKVGADGIAWTADGIPFKSAKDGLNIAVVSLAGAFPRSVDIPIKAAGKTLYLMIGGTTFAMQSHVVNIRIALNYADGTSDVHDMVNPFDIGDCWNQYRFHDCAASGFENIGGRFGPAGSCVVEDMTKPIAVDTDADLVAFELKQGTELRSVNFEAIANDVIFGVMGATVLR